MLRGRRVSVHLPFMDLSPGSPDPAIVRTSLARLEQAASWALELGAVRAVGHLGYSPDTHRDLAAFCRRLAAGLAPLAARLAGGGCLLVLENTFEPGPGGAPGRPEGHHGRRRAGGGLLPGRGPRLLPSRPPPCPPGGRPWPPYLGEMHLHDNDGTFDQHRPPGCGLVDWAFVGRAIASLDQPPLLTMEPHAEPDLWAFLRGLEKVWGPPPLA